MRQYKHWWIAFGGVVLINLIMVILTFAFSGWFTLLIIPNAFAGKWLADWAMTKDRRHEG